MIISIQKTLMLLFIIVLLIIVGCKKSSTEPKNNPPVINSITVFPSSVSANGLAAVTVVATDADNDPLNYIFTPDGGTISSGSGASKLWTAPNTPGEYSIALRVTDGEGGETTDTGNLTVTEVVTQISGIAQFKDGVTGDFTNAEVILYASWNDFVGTVPYISIPVSLIGNYAFFNIPDIERGNYFLEVWSDNDNSGNWSEGDYIGIFGPGELGSIDPESIEVLQGATVVVEITVDVASAGIL